MRNILNVHSKQWLNRCPLYIILRSYIELFCVPNLVLIVMANNALARRGRGRSGHSILCGNSKGKNYTAYKGRNNIN